MDTLDDIMILEPDWSTQVGDDVAEVFSPPRVVTMAKRNGLTGTWSFDRLVERSPGERWDLGKKSHQQEVIKLIEKTRPGLLVGSPPCSWFSRVMQINWGRIPRWRRRQMLREAGTYLDFS